MDDRERWKALQSRLAEARAAFAAGDRAAALDAANAALAIDPDFAAAQSLRQRLRAAARPTQPALAAADGGPANPPIGSAIVSADSYARFEARAKRRRVQRRLEAARAAIAQSRFDEAAAAVDEVRRLDPRLAELPALESAIAGRPPRRRVRSRRAMSAALFAAIVLTASSLQDGRAPSQPGLAAPRTSAPRLPEPLPPAAAASIATVPEPATVATTGAAPEPAAIDAASEPAATSTAPERPPASAAPAPTTPVVRGGAGDERRPAPAPAILPQSRREAVPRGAPLFPPAAPAIPRAVAPPPPPAALPGAAATSGAAAPRISAVPLADDEQLVHQTLQRYRWAYEDLDAASAHAVWPAVDEAALARAFDGLASQALTFENCDVLLDGAAASATCSGTTRYVPKVGSREPRVEPRRWSFSLRKRGGDWQIESARAGR